MRKMIVMVLGLLTALLAACSAAGVAEPTPAGAPSDPTTSEPALRPASGAQPSSPSTDGALAGGYPAAGGETAASGYPATGQDTATDGYPASGLVSPSEVDLSQLTPVAGNPTPQEAPAPGRPGNSPPASQALLLEAAMLDLSQHVDLPAEAISLVSVEPITWPNAALGCPEPGVAYAEVMVEGSRVTLAAGEQEYTYHTDGASQFVLCVEGERVSEGVVPRR